MCSRRSDVEPAPLSAGCSPLQPLTPHPSPPWKVCAGRADIDPEFLTADSSLIEPLTSHSLPSEKVCAGRADRDLGVDEPPARVRQLHVLHGPPRTSRTWKFRVDIDR